MPRLTKISLITTIILIIIFLTVLLRGEPKLQTPLINMAIEVVSPKNATFVSNAPIITGEIKNDIKGGTYIIAGNAIINAGTTVNIAPETIFYANRDARIIVHGQLVASGVTWQSNQIYSQRRYWYGLVAEQRGNIVLTNCRIQDATTGVTATQDGKITISGKLTNNVVGLAILEGGKAVVEKTEIGPGTVGLQLVGGEATLDSITFSGLVDGLRIFHNSKIAINKPRFLHINGKFVRYLAEPNLTINNVLNNNPTIFSSMTYDGRNQPVYLWQGHEYKPGIVSYNVIK